MKRLLSLFDYTGNWSEPYRAAGWEVTQVDLALGQDILTWDYQQFSPDHFNGILAAVPCTAYSAAGCHLWAKKDADGTTEKFDRITRKTLEIIDYFHADINFYAIENPKGRIAQRFPELKNKRLLSFQPWQFGEPYTKYTVLYGEFNPFLIQRPVIVPKGQRQRGSDSIDAYHGLTGRYADRAAGRSQTPKGFSQAFFEANH